MINLTIKQKIGSYFKQKYQAFDYRRGWLKGTCPMCDSQFKFGINLSVNVVHCFKCSYINSASNTIMVLENLSTWKEFLYFIEPFPEEFRSLIKTEPKQEIVSSPRVLPEGFVLLRLGKGQLKEIFKRYLVYKRHISMEVAYRARVGYVPDFNSKYFGYLIFPVVGDIRPYKTVYFQARKVFGNGPKFNNPEISDQLISKTSLFYNGRALYKYKKVYWVESILNGLTLGVQSIASLGKGIHKMQISKVLESPVEEVIIALDPDALVEAIQLAFKLIWYKRVKVLILPEGFDVNDLGRRAVLEVEKNTPYASYNSLTNLNLNIICK